jgi:hypothetical protein
MRCCTLRFLANRLAFLSFLAAMVLPFAAMRDCIGQQFFGHLRA